MISLRESNRYLGFLFAFHKNSNLESNSLLSSKLLICSTKNFSINIYLNLVNLVSIILHASDTPRTHFLYTILQVH